MVRIGIIGMGWIGKIHARWAKAIEECRLVAVAETNKELLEKIKVQYNVEGYTDYRMILERKDIDAVYIATPVAMHFQMAKDSLEAGKHVLCEKPLVLRSEEANMLRRLVIKSGRKFMVDFPIRYTISGQEAKLAIDQGLIGQVLYVRGNFRFFTKRHREKHGEWAFSREQGGGLIVEASVHLWDAIRYWTGREIIDVICVTHETDVNGKPLEDNVSAIANLDGGGIACIDLSGTLPLDSPTDKRFEIIGDRGSIYIDEFRHYLTINSEIGYETNPEDIVRGMTYPDVFWHSKIEGGISRLQREFIRCIREDVEPTPDVEDGARACEISWAALKSLSTRKLEIVKYGTP